ncbi:MAG TPA: GGDEF domain-containing protein [Arenimonas sp.]|nr:GGDEF domain-containing protein [Arenimonas sp.]
MATPASPTHPAVALGYYRYAQVVVVLMLLSGTVALTGWALESPALTRLLPASPAMKANTAIGFLLSGLALAQFLRRGTGCGLLSMLVAALGVATLAEYIQGIDLGIDGLFADPESILAGAAPGRMSQLTAVGFVLIGLRGSLACLDRLAWLRDPLSVLLLGIAMIGLASLGFLLAGVALDDLPFQPVAANTALLFLLGGLAWMAAEPEHGMTRISTADSLGGALARRLLLPSLLLPLLIIYVGQLLQSRLGYSDTMMRTLSAVLTGGAVASLIWWVSTLLDRVERERRETQRMKDSADTDGLTGLPNRRAFDEAMGRLLSGRREKDTRFCLLMLDLDFFKSYNDSFGHLAGDDALRITARLLRDALRPGDLPARYGGEEFAALLPGSDGDDGLQVAARINRLFREEQWPLRPVTVSIGVAEAHPGDDAASLIARADAALYAAKHGGRDRAELAPASPVSAAG